ncbi:hypothetical protein [Frankia sp. Cas3]|uniref:hypothetical protein n=1 Tax=Frankia sp. Cas3 TaxID=3073926 RepID=UPI002AD58ECC|nr:hypothetical protein [Frankia sp. Cas3]
MELLHLATPYVQITEGEVIGYKGKSEAALPLVTFRAVDSTSWDLYGRYESNDPLEFQGGFNPPCYVPNPITRLDPFGLAPCDRLNWSSRANRTSVQNAFAHWKKRGGQFPHIPNALQFVRKAHEFMDKPPLGARTVRTTRYDGAVDIETWDPATNIFGVRSDGGLMRTFQVLDPSHPSYANIVGRF